MHLAKMTTKSLVLDIDLDYSQRLGIPVEVFSLQVQDTIEFGKIQLYSDQFVCINNKLFNRSKYLFFGCQNSD